MLAGRMRMTPPEKGGGEDGLILYQRDDDSYQDWQEGYFNSPEGMVVRPAINAQYLRLYAFPMQETAIVTKTTYDLTDYNYIQLSASDTSLSVVDISALSGSFYVRFHKDGSATNHVIVGTGQMDSASVYTIKKTGGGGASFNISYVALTKEAPA